MQFQNLQTISGRVFKPEISNILFFVDVASHSQSKISRPYCDSIIADEGLQNCRSMLGT